MRLVTDATRGMSTAGEEPAFVIIGERDLALGHSVVLERPRLQANWLGMRDYNHFIHGSMMFRKCREIKQVASLVRLV